MDQYILAKLIGSRAKELDEGAEPYLIDKSCRSSISLALVEYRARKLDDYIVVLPRPGGGTIEMKVSEFE